jgi:hypothetical protein
MAATSDAGRLSTARKKLNATYGERFCALATCVNYIKNDMRNTLGFYKRDPSDYALAKGPVEAHFPKFGVAYAGGMIGDAASSKPGTAIDGFHGFDGLPFTGRELKLDRKAFARYGESRQIPADMELHKGFSDIIRPWTPQVIRGLSNRVAQGR